MSGPFTVLVTLIGISAACSTLPTLIPITSSITPLLDSGVFSSELVPVFAMSSGCKLVSSVSHFVKRVAAPRVPAQVFQTVVGWIAVVMARLHSWRAGSNERGQYRAVARKDLCPDAVAAVTARGDGSFQDALADLATKCVNSCKSFYITGDRHLVAGEVGNVSPHKSMIIQTITSSRGQP